MAGPYTGTWRASVVSDAKYSGALKQGTGINPVHAIRGNEYYEGLLETKLNYPEPNLGIGDDNAPLIDDTSYWPCPEDDPTALYGYNSETGLADRPRLGVPSERTGVSECYPPWGGSRKTLPGGNFIRSVVKGAIITMTARESPSETVTEGWRNKEHGIPANSIASSDAQLIVNTSGVQRYQARNGSQSTGRASEYKATVPSRVTGQKVKVYSEGKRHWDMTPYGQDEILRPFLSRQAGTSYQQWAGVNSMYDSEPLDRQIPLDPYSGKQSPSDTGGYGFVAEDGMYY
jgi:hypothetical protein